MAFDTILWGDDRWVFVSRDCIMPFAADYVALCDRLDEELRVAPGPAPDLFSKVIGSACTRIPVLSRPGRATRIDRLIESGAWTDAALALIELELPTWELRRLNREDDEWFCSLSRQQNLPAMLDDTADANHQLMPIALLLAFLQACRITGIAPQVVSAVPALDTAEEWIICCDNFA
jgi:hypothetical protein